MLKTPSPQQHHLEMVTLEELVSKDYLVRKVDATIDFESKCSAYWRRLRKISRKWPYWPSCRFFTG